MVLHFSVNIPISVAAVASTASPVSFSSFVSVPSLTSSLCFSVSTFSPVSPGNSNHGYQIRIPLTSIKYPSSFLHGWSGFVTPTIAFIDTAICQQPNESIDKRHSNVTYNCGGTCMFHVHKMLLLPLSFIELWAEAWFHI